MKGMNKGMFQGWWEEAASWRSGEGWLEEVGMAGGGRNGQGKALNAASQHHHHHHGPPALALAESVSKAGPVSANLGLGKREWAPTPSR